MYPILKALHVIAIVAWFAGLFYMVRLQIYFVEAESKPPVEKKAIQDQLAIMQRKLLYIITHPAMGAALLFGTILLVKYQIYKQPWMHIKLTFVFLLIAYQIYVGRIYKALIKGTNKLTSKQLRWLNEFPTLILIVVVLLAYIKPTF